MEQLSPSDHGTSPASGEDVLLLTPAAAAPAPPGAGHILSAGVKTPLTHMVLRSHTHTRKTGLHPGQLFEWPPRGDSGNVHMYLEAQNASAVGR